MPFVPYTPYLQTWDNWNSLMIEAFSEQALPKVDESDWRQFGNALAGNTAFAEYAIPDPDGFSQWEDWVDQVLVVTNGQYT